MNGWLRKMRMMSEIVFSSDMGVFEETDADTPVVAVRWER